MTVQRGDKIIIDNRMYSLFSNPLDYVFPDIQGKIKAEWYSGELRIPLAGPVICEDFPYYPPDAYIVTEIDWFIRVDKGRIVSHIYNANS